MSEKWKPRNKPNSELRSTLLETKNSLNWLEKNWDSKGRIHQLWDILIEIIHPREKENTERCRKIILRQNWLKNVSNLLFKKCIYIQDAKQTNA